MVNLAVTIGPMIGGLLAARNYLFLFLSDAVSSLITAAIVYLALRESRPAPAEDAPAETVAATFAGYLDVVRNRAFAWFAVTSMLAILVYVQMNSSLAVYLRDSHGVSDQGFGYLLSLNGAMVVVLQFPIARWMRRFRPLLVMTAGTVLYAIGFGIYGFVGAYALFLAAMAIITLGEMLVSPTSQAIVASMAPGAMRGRYMAVYGYAWLLPWAVGPFMAGLIMDNADPRWVWYGAGIVGLVAAAGYYLLEWRAQRAMHAAIDRRLEIVQALESGRISAEQAAGRIQVVEEDALVRLAPPRAESGQRYVRLRVGDLASGAVKADLRLPLALVNAALHTGGSLSAGVGSVDPAALRAAVAVAAAGEGAQTLTSAADEDIEVSIESD
jgi:MFS family permease